MFNPSGNALPGMRDCGRLQQCDAVVVLFGH